MLRQPRGRVLDWRGLPVGGHTCLEMGYQNSIYSFSCSVGLKVLFFLQKILNHAYLQPMLPTM